MIYLHRRVFVMFGNKICLHQLFVLCLPYSPIMYGGNMGRQGSTLPRTRQIIRSVPFLYQLFYSTRSLLAASVELKKSVFLCA